MMEKGDLNTRSLFLRVSCYLWSLVVVVLLGVGVVAHERA